MWGSTWRAPRYESVVLVEVFGDAVEQMSVSVRAAPAGGDRAQDVNVQTARRRGHRASRTVMTKLGNSRSRYSRT
jgi:hypothetical protein